MSVKTIRTFAVHRKNWLFADNLDGSKTNAVIYTYNINRLLYLFVM